MFLEISQESQENSCARVSFLIKLQAEACNFIKKETLAQVFPVNFAKFRSSHLEVFSEKGVLKICSKFMGEHPCRCVISIKLLYNFIELALRHRFSPVNFLHIFRTPFPKNTSGRLLLKLFKNTFSTEHLSATASASLEAKYKVCVAGCHMTIDLDFSEEGGSKGLLE